MFDGLAVFFCFKVHLGTRAVRCLFRDFRFFDAVAPHLKTSKYSLLCPFKWKQKSLVILCLSQVWSFICYAISVWRNASMAVTLLLHNESKCNQAVCPVLDFVLKHQLHQLLHSFAIHFGNYNKCCIWCSHSDYLIRSLPRTSYS